MLIRRSYLDDIILNKRMAVVEVSSLFNTDDYDGTVEFECSANPDHILHDEVIERLENNKTLRDRAEKAIEKAKKKP